MCKGNYAINKVFRYGLRYINFRSVIQTGDFLTNLAVVNNGNLNIGGKTSQGSLIDVDTYLESPDIGFFKNFDSIIEKSHNEEKELFFTILKQEFIDTLNPEYKNG